MIYLLAIPVVGAVIWVWRRAFNKALEKVEERALELYDEFH